MFSENISIWLVFAEGLLSFLSPCILPLLPVYFSFLAGATVNDIENNTINKSNFIKNSLGFVLGLSIIFVILGAGASFAGKIFFVYKDLIRQIGSIFVFIFGLHQTGLIKLRVLNYEKRFNFKEKSTSFINSFLLGVLFSFGWTPCIGPILGSVLFLAGNSGTMASGMALLFIYSLGMTIPFLLSTFAVGFFMKSYQKLYKYFNIVKIISGIILMIAGVLMYFNLLGVLSF